MKTKVAAEEGKIFEERSLCFPLTAQGELAAKMLS